MDLTFDHGPYGAPWSYPARIAKARERKVLSLELEVTQYIPEIVRKTLWWFNVPIFKNQNVLIGKWTINGDFQ